VIALLDYGAGNLASVRKAFAALGAEVRTPSSVAELACARAIVVPGVGHFNRTASLENVWRDAVAERIAAGVPLFGICLGLQWLFVGSAEAPAIRGLGLFGAQCELIRAAKVPHVGWNTLVFPRPSRLMVGVPADAQVYFTHSYAAPVVHDTVAVATHGEPFSAAVERGNVAAVQFHPEKSGAVGLHILRNWLDAL
jgi:glutamine amidotransferase